MQGVKGIYHYNLLGYRFSGLLLITSLWRKDAGLESRTKSPIVRNFDEWAFISADAGRMLVISRSV